MNKKIMASILAPTLLVGGLASMQPSSTAYAKTQKNTAHPKENVIEFQDANIKEMVLLELSNILHRPATDADLTQENLDKITNLATLPGSHLTTLVDLEHLPNLTSLSLMASTGSEEFDTTPLSKLNKLKDFTFWLSGSGKLSSLKPLQNKPLNNLTIHADPTSEPSESVLETLSQLKTIDILYFDTQQDRSVGNLDNLPDLQEITLHNIGLTVAPTLAASKKLTYASFADNNISMVPDMSNFKELEILNVGNNKIKDYTNVDKLLALPKSPSIDLTHNLLTTYPAIAEEIKPANLNFNFIVGHKLKFQYAIKPIEPQELNQGENKVIPIEWIEDGTNFPPLDDFTAQQKEYVDTKNAHFSLDNANISIAPQGSNIEIKANEGVTGKTNVTMTYDGDLKTSFEVNVK